MSLDSRTRLILWIGIGGVAALILAYLPSALGALGDVLF